MVLALCIACSWLGFSSLTSKASTEGVNVARMEGAIYHWSGTWENGGIDATTGDAGSKCFDGDYNNKWGSANKSNGDQWVSVTFPSAIEIIGFKVWQDSGSWTDATGFKVQIQNGTDTWEDVYSFDRSDSQKWATKEITAPDPVTATAFRVYVTSAQIGAFNAVELSEIEVYSSANIGTGSGNSNKAFKQDTISEVSTVGAIATASSFSQPSSNAFDGNMDTKWGSQGASTPQWIQINFPNTVDIAGYVLNQDFDWSDITAYKVEVAVNDEWETVYTYSAGTSIGTQHEIKFDTLWNTDTIRFTITGVGSNCSRGASPQPTTSIDFKEVKIYTAEEVVNAGNGTGNTNKAFNLDAKTAVSVVGATATASSASQPASNAIDGNMDTKWGSQGSVTPQWLQVTFPNTVDMAGYVLNQDFDWSDVTAYKVEVAVNNEWETAYTYSVGTSIGTQNEILFDTLWNTDTIRFTFTTVGNNANIGNNHATTSIDFKEVLIYTASEKQPNAGENPSTGENAFVLTGSVLTMVAATVILKRKNYAF